MSYAALVLDSVDRKVLLAHLQGVIPQGWEVVAHHMTIQFPCGSHPLEGQHGNVIVSHCGMDGRVCAVKLAPVGMAVESKNAIPHITIAVNRAGGGKPVHSNEIQNWKSIPNFMIGGKVKICS